MSPETRHFVLTGLKNQRENMQHAVSHNKSSVEVCRLELNIAEEVLANNEARLAIIEDAIASIEQKEPVA